MAAVCVKRTATQTGPRRPFFEALQRPGTVGETATVQKYRPPAGVVIKKGGGRGATASRNETNSIRELKCLLRVTLGYINEMPVNTEWLLRIWNIRTGYAEN
jgi:hypothetical protein